MSNATSLETYTIKGSIQVIERFFDLPLNYAQPDGTKIRVFARHLIPTSKTKTLEEASGLPYLLYLQGGPGFEVDLHGILEIAAVIHEQGYQTLWLDPRGTGLSSPFSAELVEDKSDVEIYQYLKHFRADNIVRDCEAIRQTLLGSKENPEDRKWTILGQSFGGFCALTYLSYHSEGLKEVFLTAGLPPLENHPDPVYDRLMRKVLERNAVYYEKYPRDVKRVRDILAYLETNEVTLPNGGRLTPYRWLQLGLDFGMHGGIDRVHQLTFRAANDLELFKKLSYRLLLNVQNKQECDSNPFFGILHEVIYCQGRAANWAGARVLKKYPQFSWTEMKSQDDSPVYFTGEMVFPEMLDDYVNLRSLKKAAELIAQDTDWCALYDPVQLAANKVKVTAASYYDDMYVDFGFAQETAAAIGNLEQYISNQHLHSAIRKDPKTVLNHLFVISKRERD